MGIATAVANALHYANRNGVIHRDIKPANILLHDGQPVVADFGIALAIGIAGGTRLTETGLSVGTPYYMSPEQATGDQIVGPQSDIYSLGAILYEMLIGEPPYTGATAQAVLGRILQGKPVSATEKRASVPRNVDACIRKSLERIPADRFATGQDMARALADSSFRSTSDTPAISATATLTRNAPLMGALAALGLIVGVFGWLRPASPEVVSRYELTPPNGEQVQGLNFAFGLAPGGDRIVFAASIGDDETARLWIKQRDRLEWAPEPGSEGGGSYLVSRPTARTSSIWFPEARTQAPSSSPWTEALPHEYPTRRRWRLGSIRIAWPSPHSCCLAVRRSKRFHRRGARPENSGVPTRSWFSARSPPSPTVAGSSFPLARLVRSVSGCSLSTVPRERPTKPVRVCRAPTWTTETYF